MKEEVIIEVKTEGPEESDIEKLAKLKTAIIHNKEEVARLTKAYKDKLITDKEFSQQVVVLEASQKKLSAAYADTQRKVTGLKDPFDRLHGSLSGNAAVIDRLIPGMGSAASGFLSMAKAAMAFIATPIGAVIAALAAVIGLVTNAIKTNDSVADDFEAVWGAISAAFEVARRNLGLLASVMVKFFAGDLTGAIATAKEFGDKLLKAGEAGYELQRALQVLEDDTNKFNLTLQAQKNRIDELVIASKNRSLTEAERITINQQAADLEKDFTEKHIALVTRAADAELKALGDKFETQRWLNESLQDYGLRLIETGKIGTVEQRKIVDAVRSVDEALNSSIKLQEKLQNQRDALADAAQVKADKALQARIDAEAKEALETLKGLEKWSKEREEFEKLKQENKDAANKAARDKELEEVRIHNEEMDNIAQANFDKEQERKNKSADLLTKFYANAVTSFEEAFKKSNDIGEALLKGFLILMLKQLKIALQAEILGKSLATPDSILSFGATGFLRAAIIIAGLEAAFAGASAAIEGFAQGGQPVRGRVGNQGVAIQRSNGDNRLVTMQSDEVVLTPSQQARVGGPAALRFAGVPGFNTGGGFETRAAYSRAYSGQSTARMVGNAINSQVPVLVVEHFERVQDRKIAVAESAKVF